MRRKDAYVVLELSDVIYFEVKDELVWAITEEDRFAIDKTLANLEDELDPEAFFRSHRGFIARYDRIRAIEPTGAGTYQLCSTTRTSRRSPWPGSEQRNSVNASHFRAEHTKTFSVYGASWW